MIPFSHQMLHGRVGLITCPVHARALHELGAFLFSYIRLPGFFEIARQIEEDFAIPLDEEGGILRSHLLAGRLQLGVDEILQRRQRSLDVMTQGAFVLGRVHPGFCHEQVIGAAAGGWIGNGLDQLLISGRVVFHF